MRLVRTEQSLSDSEEPLFALPDIIDEEKGPYVDFLDYITKLRVRLLNDSIDFEKTLSSEEVTEELTEKYRLEYFEGACVHVYRELTDILEYVPEGFDLDKEEKKLSMDDYENVDTGDIDEETIEEDETMRWDDWDESIENKNLKK